MNFAAAIRVVVLLSTAANTAAIAGEGNDWPAFRGPAGNGLTAARDVPIEWGRQQNIRWKASLPQPGNGSPIVSAGRVFVCGAEDARGHKRSVYCFDADTGDKLWVRTVDFDRDMPTHNTNPHCSTTPAANGERVVVWHTSAGLYCYDFSGVELWSRNLGEFKHMWGHGSSPVIHDGRVFLNCSAGKRNFLAAVALENGELLWEQEEPYDGDGDRNAAGKYMGSWSTPVVTAVDGADQVLCAMPTRLNSYDPASGRILWTCDGIRGPKGDLAYSSPMVSGNRCVTIGGFGGPGIALTLGGSGNVTASHRTWRVEKNPQSIGTGVFIGDHVYRPGADRRGPIECQHADTGKIRWRAPIDAACWGSIIAAEDRLYVTTQEGTTLVFEPTPDEFRVLAKNELRERSNSTPAIVNGRIYLRTFRGLYCVGGD